MSSSIHLRPAGSQLIDLHLTGAWAVSHRYKAGAALMCVMSAAYQRKCLSDRCCKQTWMMIACKPSSCTTGCKLTSESSVLCCRCITIEELTNQGYQEIVPAWFSLHLIVSSVVAVHNK